MEHRECSKFEQNPLKTKVKFHWKQMSKWNAVLYNITVVKMFRNHIILNLSLNLHKTWTIGATYWISESDYILEVKVTGSGITDILLRRLCSYLVSQHCVSRYWPNLPNWYIVLHMKFSVGLDFEGQGHWAVHMSSGDKDSVLFGYICTCMLYWQ